MPQNHLLIDGQNIAHMVYGLHMHSSPGSQELKAPDGTLTTVLKGTMNMIAKMLEKLGHQQIIVAYDGVSPSWRYDIEPSYKGGFKPRNHRSPFGEQIAQMPEHLAAFGIKTIRVNQLEGDDVIALLAESDKLSGQSVLVSEDKDMLAYVGPTTYYYAPRSKKLVKPANFDEFTQGLMKISLPVGTEGWPLFRAFVGDTSDQIKGVSQCGPVYASEIIHQIKQAGGVLSGYTQDFGEIREQLVAFGPSFPNKLKPLVSEKALAELELSYNLVRVENAPQGAKAELHQIDLDDVTPPSVASIQKKLDELGFKQWLENTNWISRFVPPQPTFDMDI